LSWRRLEYQTPPFLCAHEICEADHAHEITLMSFIETLDSLALRKSELIECFEHLIAPKSDQELETMAQSSRALTLQNFGRTMRLFAPLYLSNECINNCQYCGFSRDNPILRVTLTADEVVAEAQHLAREGFRQILLVAGEHPKFVSGGYLVECVRALASDFSSISIEVGPMDTEDYVPIVEAWRRRARRLSGDLQSRCVCRDAYGWPETRF
jgi:2-iminoacetate synthase